MIAAEHLAQVPGCEGGQKPLAVTRLNGRARSRSVWRVQSTVGNFALLQHEVATAMQRATARWECAAHHFAAPIGIAPSVVAAAADGSWMVTEYLDGPAWSCDQLRSDSGIDALAAALTRLHAIPVPKQWPAMDANAIAAQYGLQLQAMGAAQTSGVAGVVQRIAHLSVEIDQLGGLRCLNHGDLVAANILGARPWLIDWEFAQVAHPTYDIACLLVYYPQLQGQKARLLAATGLSSPADQALLALQCERFAGLNQLWHAVEASKAG